MSIVFRVVLTFLIGALIFVGLPLIGWGVIDIAGFFSHPARVIYVVLVIFLTALAAIKIPSVGKKPDKGKQIVRRQHITVVLLQVFSLLIVTVGPYCDRRNLAVLEESNIIRDLGIMMYTIGFVVILWTQDYLGKQLSLEVTIQEGHRLVTDGPFRCLCHPRYLGSSYSPRASLWPFVHGLRCVLLPRAHWCCYGESMMKRGSCIRSSAQRGRITDKDRGVSFLLYSELSTM